MKTPYKETNTRSIVKCISYRFLGSAVTCLIAFILTGNTSISLGVGLFDLVSKLICYYIHERIWNFIPFGKVKDSE